MIKRVVVVGGAVPLVALAVLWRSGRSASAVASDGAPAVAGVIPAASMGVLQDAEFVGAGKCKKCHLPAFKSWEKLKHAHAMDTLKPGNATEAKAKFKLDPNKDYSKDETCLPCHTTGYGKPGGFALATDEGGAKKMEAMANVGCESCHGAGGKYLDLHDEIMKSKRKYKQEEMRAAGSVIPTAEVCMTCHNEKSPTFDPAKKFDFESMKEKGVHERTPLKQRE
jgi:hypothetical protein